MAFNNIINHLKLWCINKAEKYENTVSFAGSILPKAKKLLLKEKERWNKFEFFSDC